MLNIMLSDSVDREWNFIRNSRWQGVAADLAGKRYGAVSQPVRMHFEWLVEPQRGGPAFVIEGVPFIGGVEYGTVVPSLTLAMVYVCRQGMSSAWSHGIFHRR